jgi:hypothetical protein
MRINQRGIRALALAASALAVTATVSVTTAAPAAAAAGSGAPMTVSDPVPPLPGPGVDLPLWRDAPARLFPSVRAPIVEIVHPPRVRVLCYVHAEAVWDGGRVSDIWYLRPGNRGWISAVYVGHPGGPGVPIPPVPRC